MNSRVVYLVIAGALLGADPSAAGTIADVWAGGSSNWGNLAFWSNGVPNNDQFNNYLVSINSGGTDLVMLTGLSPAVTSLNLGGSIGTSNLQVTGSTLGIVNGLTIGSGTMSITNSGIVNAGGFAEIGNGATGGVIVSGAGSQFNNTSFVAVGATGTPGTGSLTLSAGATGSNALNFAVGDWGFAHGTVMLTGAGTQWVSSGQMIVGGFSGNGSGTDPGTGSVTVTNGAMLSTAKGSSPTGSSGIIGLVGGTGVVTVSNGGAWYQDGNLHVGQTTSGGFSGIGNGTLDILSGGVVNDVAGAINFNDNSIGTVLVSGAGSTWNNSGTLDVGTDVGTGNGHLTVENGGLVTATMTTIHPNGTLDGAGGTIQGILIDHGTLSPGDAPGTLTVNGGFTEASDGSLIFQTAGTQTTAYSQLFVNGQGTFSGLIDFDFIGGFAPVKGQTFNYITDLVSADFSQATFAVSGLAPGFQFSTQFANGVFSMTANNNGVSTTPEPAAGLLTGCAIALLFSQRIVRTRAAGRRAGKAARRPAEPRECPRRLQTACASRT